MSAEALGSSGGAGYLQRIPERLVVNGLRLWAAGYQAGDLHFWQDAWNLYAVALGPQRARPAVTQLSHWVKAICLWRPQRLGCFAAGCPFVCRDECLALGLVAACQHQDATCLGYCAEALAGPAGHKEVAESAAGFAMTLQGFGQVLLPVPENVVRGLIQRPPSASLH